MNAMQSSDGGTIAFGSAGPGRDSTLGLLAVHGHDLLFACRRCGHARIVPMDEVIARLGDRAEYNAVRGRCTRCGSRAVMLRHTLRLSEPEPPPSAEPVLEDALAF